MSSFFTRICKFTNEYVVSISCFCFEQYQCHVCHDRLTEISSPKQDFNQIRNLLSSEKIYFW